ncbi:MAG: histidine phosphatase family protein [Gemmatimonadaceae bacterium]|nr:histidine phosphatase family protein [Gemmatimonadaceae bacterium]
MRRLILVRHCQASGQDPEDGLTAEGMSQAEALRDFLLKKPVETVVASEYRRAQQSAEPLAAALGLPLRVDGRLNERKLASAPLESWREVVRDSFKDLDLRAPGGESAREVLARGWASLNDLLDGELELPMAVTHGNLMSLILNSIDGTFGYQGWEGLSNPDVYLLADLGGGPMSFRRLWER